MLKTTDNLTSYSLAAGEPFLLSVQVRDNASNAIVDMSQRPLVLSFYEASTRTVAAQIDGVITTDASGSFLRFARDGAFSDSLFGKTLSVELAERLKGGRSTLAVGRMEIVTSALTVATYGSIVGRTETRISVYLDAAGIPRVWEQALLPFSSAVVSAPVFTTPASISSDGTPQVGETLTGVDGVATDTLSYTRRWLFGGNQVATTKPYVPQTPGAYTYEVTATGAGGTTLSSSTTNVAAATIPAPAFTRAPAISPTSGQVGATFTAADGAVSNGSISTRRWLLSGTAIGTGATVVPASAGSLVLENTATGTDGSTITATSAAVTVAAAGVPTIAFAIPSTSVPEGNTGTTTVSNVINVTRNGVTGPLTINLTYGGTATSGADYTAGPVSATIADGVDSASFDLTINGDTNFEPNETIIINAVLAAYTSSTASKTITITDEDVAPLTFMTAGSSTWDKAFSQYTGPANSAVTVSTNGTTFTPLGTAGGGATVLGDLLNKATGAPIRFLTKAVSATELADWEAGGSTQRAAAVAAANAAGNLTAILWAGGINDARDGVVTSQASHAAKLRSCFAKMRSEIGKPNLPIFIETSQKVTTGSVAASMFNPQVIMVRSAELDLINNDANVYLYTHTIDLTQQSDALHQDAAAYTLSSTRGASAIAAVLAGAAVKRGPKVLSAVAVSDTQTRVTFAANITPASAISGFQLSTDNFATVITPTSAVRVSGQPTQVLLTHATTGTSVVTAAVQYQQTPAPDVTGPVFSDTTPAFPADYTTPTAPVTFQTIAGPPPAFNQSSPLTDNYEGTNGSTLASHTADSGHTYTQVNGTHIISGGDLIGTAIGNALSSYVPVDASYQITAKFVVLTAINNFHNTLIRFRVQDDSNYFYAGIAQNASGQFYPILSRTVGGTAVTNTNGAPVAITPGAIIELRIVVGLNGQHAVYVDGATTPALTVTDDVVALQPKGRIGFRQSQSAATATTGTHIQSLTVVDAS